MQEQWHNFSPDEALLALSARRSGLADTEAVARLPQYGANELKGKKNMTAENEEEYDENEFIEELKYLAEKGKTMEEVSALTGIELKKVKECARKGKVRFRE